MRLTNSIVIHNREELQELCVANFTLNLTLSNNNDVMRMLLLAVAFAAIAIAILDIVWATYCSDSTMMRNSTVIHNHA